MACFTVMARFPSSVTVAGLSLLNSCRISFTWLAVMLMVVSPVIDGGMPLDLSFAFGGQAARLPTGLRSKP